jgi:hypothetical protein
MTPYETAIAALAEALEAKLEIGSDRLCDVEVDGRLVVLRPIGETEASIMMFSIAAAASDGGKLSAEVKERALSMNLFGTNTLGGHLGLFGESIILSAPPIEATGLSVESFAERMLAFSRFTGEVEEKLAGGAAAEDDGETFEDEADTAPESDFIKV